MIGDGMGAAAVSAASYAKGAPLEMATFAHTSFLRTHEHEYVTTDSAASATAYATGEKTHYEGVSVKAGTPAGREEDASTHMETMVELARSKGWGTGLVATSRIVHATPAAFAAHRANRSSYEQIARDMHGAGVDVMLGAGSRYFQDREDGEDLLAAMAEGGYAVAKTAPEVRAAVDAGAERLVGLMHEKDMPFVLEGGRAMSLEQMFGAAVEVLDGRERDGWFLMVEGSFIDWEEHAMNGEGTIAETLDFDAAVAAARRYAAGRDDTLVIVTADHETGGFSPMDGADAMGLAEALGGMGALDARVKAQEGVSAFPPVVYEVRVDGAVGSGLDGASGVLAATFGHLSVASRAYWDKPRHFPATHSATMVPMFAEGVGAAWVSQARDNAELGEMLRRFVAGDEVEHREDAFVASAPENVVLMVGAGMGLSTWTAAYYGEGSRAALEAPVRGLAATHPQGGVVGDAASGASALSTGARVGRGAIAVAKGAELVTLLERAEARGLRTGIVTAGSLTGAGAAAFYAHMERHDPAEAAAALAGLSGRVEGSDGVDVVMASDAGALTGVQREALGEALEVDARASVEELTARALEKLEAAGGRFVLVVVDPSVGERLGQLDRTRGVVERAAAFDAAAGRAFGFARRRGDTAVVVTADTDQTLSVLDTHYGFSEGWCGAAKRCGGDFELVEVEVRGEVERGEGFADEAVRKGWAPTKMILQYAWLAQVGKDEKGLEGARTATFVPVFAYGPGAEVLRGFSGQAEVGAVLAGWVGR
jgi:alkaline phosphatase